MLIYEMVKGYVEEFESFDKSSLSRRHYDETYAQHHRDTLEAEFVKICIPRQEHFGAIIKRHREARKLSLLESLLLEGSGAGESFATMRVLSGHLRQQKELDFELFKVKLAEKDYLKESQLWEKVQANEKMLEEASDLKEIYLWLKHVHESSFQKLSYKEAQEMSVQKFCEQYGGLDIFNRFKKTWQRYEGRNFAK